MSLVNILRRLRLLPFAPTSHAQAGRNKQTMELEKAEVCVCGCNRQESSFFLRVLPSVVTVLPPRSASDAADSCSLLRSGLVLTVFSFHFLPHDRQV